MQQRIEAKLKDLDTTDKRIEFLHKMSEEWLIKIPEIDLMSLEDLGNVVAYLMLERSNKIQHIHGEPV